jgi:hypothetical protein
MKRITITDDLTDDEAIALLRRIEDRLGWAIGVFTRKDAEAMVGRPFTNDEWTQVTAHGSWSKQLSTVMWAEAECHAAYPINRVVAIPEEN